MKRCFWVDEKSKLCVKYHDTEWGIPKHDDKKLFEFLVLESFQSGLSWLTILKKRKFFRKAFDDFNVNKIAHYGKTKINELLENQNIIRNRSKIEAAVNNAKVFIKIQREYGSFSDYIWHWTDGKVIKNTSGKIMDKSILSDVLLLDLKVRGMKYLGTTTVYAYLQAIGVINDHDRGCFKY